MTEDEKEFGVKTIVYCNQHLSPHYTGWCTVDNRNKIKLESIDLKSAADECRKKDYKLFFDLVNKN